MNKKSLIAWPVIFVVWMGGSFLVHGVLLADDYAQLPNLFRTEADTQNYAYLMALAHVILAGAFVWIYQRGKEDKPWLAQGLRFGIAVAFLTVVPTYTIYYVVQPLPGAMVVRQILFDGALILVLGVVTALLCQDKKPA